MTCWVSLRSTQPTLYKLGFIPSGAGFVLSLGRKSKKNVPILFLLQPLTILLGDKSKRVLIE